MFKKKHNVPFASLEQIKKELERLVKTGVLAKLQYSDWAAPTVYVKKKSKEIRIHTNFSIGLNAALKDFNYVVLGWMISLSVEPGIEPGIFRFQSKVLATPLPSLHSSSTFLLLSLSLSFSLSLSVLLLSFLFHLLSCFCFSLRKSHDKKKRVGFYSRHSTHNPFP